VYDGINKEEEMNKRKIGKFRIPQDYIRSQVKLLNTIFAELKIVPIRFETLLASREIEYIAIGDCFDEVSEEQIIPEYILNCETDKDNHVKNITMEKL
jgi:hypothetical protein